MNQEDFEQLLERLGHGEELYEDEWAYICTRFDVHRNEVKAVMGDRERLHALLFKTCVDQGDPDDFDKRNDAEAMLRAATRNSAAQFHPGQWEAIHALVYERKQVLVVQRTGWGKSSVYFIATRLLRDEGMGITIIISPLLALMRNQIDAANRLGVRAATMNSSNPEDWNRVTEDIRANNVDALLISPERLANEEFITEVLEPLGNRIGMLVIDEVHCISDWGHDFRPDYRRITRVLQQMPRNLPVLGCTATANNRVVDDIVEMLPNIEVQRGPLTRESVGLQAMRLPTQAERMAWLAQYVPKLPGTGIIYVLTRRDAALVATWLQANNITAEPYFGGIQQPGHSTSAESRQRLEEALLANEVKALVATTALGMGYDKPDLGFVIHFQAPSSVITYYQQVGRAGRGIANAYGILLTGLEDDDIHAYFRESAFPDEAIVQHVIDVLEQREGATKSELENALNVRGSRIDKVLKLLNLESPAPIFKDGRKWYRAATTYQPDRARIDRLNKARLREWEETQLYVAHQGCRMQFLGNSLDDPTVQPCGRCDNCVGNPLIPTNVSPNLVLAANLCLRNSEMPWKPRIRIPSGALSSYEIQGNIPPRLRPAEGRVLARWGDSGWGDTVRQDKQIHGRFRQELVHAVSEMITNRWVPHPAAAWLTCVPSLRHPDLVPEFAQQLANSLNVPYFPLIRKARSNAPQKTQENAYHQCRNLDGVFEIVDDVPNAPVLLVDDIVDSGWTMTIVALLLREAGSGPVYPVALASTSTD